jgi:hypothetical protein
MTGRDSQEQSRHQRSVRPRWVWGGLAVAIAGAALLGLGVAMLSWTVSVIGTVLLVLGAAAAVRGGALYDAVGEFEMHHELEQVRGGDVHGGVAPGENVTTPAARRDAIETDRAVGERLARAHRVSTRWAPVAGGMLLLVTAVLLASQWEGVTSTATGRGNSVRDTCLAVILGLGGIRLVTAPGRHLFAVVVSLLAGLGVVLGGLLADHKSSGLAIVEVSCGLVAVLCALTAYLSPAPPPGG